MDYSHCYASPSTWCYRCWCPHKDDAWTDLPRNLYVEEHVSNDKYGGYLGSKTSKVDTIGGSKIMTIGLQFLTCFGTGFGLFAGTCPSVIGMSVGGSCCLIGTVRCCHICCSDWEKKSDQTKLETTDSQGSERITKRVHYCETSGSSGTRVQTVFMDKYSDNNSK